MQTNKEPVESRFLYWLYILSPCVIAAAILMYEIIDNFNTLAEDRMGSMIGLIFMTPAFLLIIAFDFMLKAIFKKTWQLWLFETAALLLMFLLIMAVR